MKQGTNQNAPSRTSSSSFLLLRKKLKYNEKSLMRFEMKTDVIVQILSQRKNPCEIQLGLHAKNV